MIDLDDEIRDAISADRDRARLPLPWHEVVDRSDRRQVHQGRKVMLAAAAVVAVGALGLVAALAVRDAGDDESADETTTGVPDVDPLAGLTANQWVVPNPIPDGYERLHAEVGHEVEGQDEAKQVQIFGGDDAAEVWLQVMRARTHAGDAEGEVELAPDEEPVTVDGIEWYRREWGSTDGPPYVTMWRNAGDRRVSLESLGDPAALERFAQALVVVPESEVDFDVLDPDGSYTEVARSTDAESEVVLRVRGLSGYYCVEYEDGDMRGRSGCSFTTSPEQPIHDMIRYSVFDRSVSFGLAAPGVERIEVDHDGDVTVIEPTDESGQFPHNFWIAEFSVRERSLQTATAVTIELDDGTRVGLEKTELDTWRVPTD